MTLIRCTVAAVCLLLAQNYLYAQDKLDIKFGKINAVDFDVPINPADSGADAIVIADIGKTTFEGDTKGHENFVMVYTRLRRCKIINKNGFDIANNSFDVYSDGINEERFSDFKAVTYNLENGKVVETKLDNKSVYTEKIGQHSSRKKFTLPGVKAGSIIEIAYTIRSDFYYHLRSWNFQGEYPVRWSEYEVHIPVYFRYAILNQGDPNFFIKTSVLRKNDYSIRKSGGALTADDITVVTVDDVFNRWVKKDVPAMTHESFTTTTDNYISRVELQLHYIQYDESADRHDYMTDWFQASKKLLENESFGLALDKNNNWMSDEFKSIISDGDDKQTKAEKIYTYVRDHFTCTDHDELFAYKPLKTVFNSKTGSVAEINLLLVALYRHEGIAADPMILSTRSNGLASEVYPLIDRFNYVICSARINERTEYLDASWPSLPFDQLPIDCYNGTARTINRENPVLKKFSADSIMEKKNTTVLIINDQKGQQSGVYKSMLGKFESYNLRKKVKEKGLKDYFKGIQTAYGTDLELENEGIDSLNQINYPATIRYDFNLKSTSQEDIIYFNPMLSERYTDNPFKSATRRYPVEMDYTFDETYNFGMEIPAGYVVDELPKSAKVGYNENQGFFEYLIQQDSSGIHLRCRLMLNRAFFTPDDYNSLRDFFGHVVKKQGEQIVFKKKK